MFLQNFYAKAHSNVIHNNPQNGNHPNVYLWINTMWYIHTRDPAIKRNELLKYTTQMNLKNIILSERSQTQKSIYYMIPFINISVKGKTRVTES